jgi:hypothetical protein
MCCKEETVNCHRRIYCPPQFHQKGLFCEGAENYAVNQSSLHILNDDDDDAGRQRLSRAQRLGNQLADYFLTPAGAIPCLWSYIN